MDCTDKPRGVDQSYVMVGIIAPVLLHALFKFVCDSYSGAVPLEDYLSAFAAQLMLTTAVRIAFFCAPNAF